MSRRLGIRVVALASFVCAGCDALYERPGHDFSLRVLDEEPIETKGEIYATVRFALDGCDAFDLGVEDGAGVRRTISYTTDADGTSVASVPVAWMNVGRCVGYGYNAENTSRVNGKLVATCHDAGRSAAADFSVRLGLALYTDRASGFVRAVFRGQRDYDPYWIATSEYDGEVTYASQGILSLRGAWGPRLNPAAYLNPLVRPRMVVASGDRAFATLGCKTSLDCPPVSIGPDESVPSERIADIGLSNGGEDLRWGLPRGVAHVSTNVIDMAFAGDGALVVVTDTSLARDPASIEAEPPGRWGETIVWRVVRPPYAPGVVEDIATVIARFPRETVVSRLATTASGALAFTTLASPGAFVEPVSVRIHLIDGSTVTTSYSAPAPGWCGVWQDSSCVQSFPFGFADSGIHLSPDGAALILTHPGDLWLYWMNTDPADRAWQPFGIRGDLVAISPGARRQLYFSKADGGAAWLPDAVALWSGGDLLYPVDADLLYLADGDYFGVVQVFETAPPHALRYEYAIEPLPGATEPPMLVGVTAVGDHLVLTTTTGVRILEAGGTLVGGMDPLPCGARTTSTAEEVGPGTVAVGVGSAVLKFDVGP